MARPRKLPTARRDRKLIVWVSAEEHARFLVRSVRAGLTGPDYVRAIACANDDALSDERVTVALEADLHAALVLEAGRRGVGLDRYLRDLKNETVLPVVGAGIASFELTDALVRIGAELQRMRAIAEDTGYIPVEIETTVARIETALDRLLPP